MTGIILSGGKSRRMTRDKAFVTVREHPLISDVYEVLDQVFSEILIITNEPENYISLQARTFHDLIPDKGPLGGLYTALTVSSTEYNFVVACDMPFLDPGFIRYLADRSAGFDALVPRCKGGCEPLHSVYSRKCLDAIQQQIHTGDLGLQAFYPRVNVGYIEQDEIERFDPRLRMFCNVNCGEDLKHVRSLVRGNDGTT